MASAPPGEPTPGVTEIPAPYPSDAAPRPDTTPLTVSPPLPVPISDPISGDPSLDHRFIDLLTIVQLNRPNDDLNLIRSAWAFCIQKHAGQLRASGEPYIGHPLEVA